MSNDLIVVDNVSKIVETTEEIKKEVALLSKDFDNSRENIVKIINKGNEAFEDFSIIAKQAQNANVYESLASLMKVVLDANKLLLELHQINNKIDKGSRESTPSITTKGGNTNIIMVGSTKEVLSLLKENDV